MQDQQNGTPLRPFQIIQTVAWGHCDPAGIIYTPRALEYATEALDAWNREVLGISWFKLGTDRQMGFPTVHAELNFLKPPAADDTVIMDLEVLEIGRSSLTTRVTCHSVDGTVYFHVKIVSCLISVPAYEPVEIIPEFRQRILAYQATCRENSQKQIQEDDHEPAAVPNTDDTRHRGH